MQFSVLGSGSKGNATYIATPRTAILIDCGFSGVEIERRLESIGKNLQSISAILLTHEHNDHIRGVGILSRRGKLPVYANSGTIEAGGDNLKNLHHHFEFQTGTSFRINELTIHPFSISHDTRDPVGFVVSNDTCSIGYCTDTGKVTKLMHHRLGGCHGLILESNHDPELLRNGPYPAFLKQRVAGKAGHLANFEAARFLEELIHDGLEHVVLAHLSETNNLPERAYETARGILPINGKKLHLTLATQNKPTPLFSLNGRS
jgi:phosphoribosyl 1,2-cyclic phosphodiesterase